MNLRDAAQAAKQVLYGNGDGVDMIEDALDILESALSTPEWQPMETAPRDGPHAQKIMLLSESGIVSVGYWDSYYAEGGGGYENWPDTWVEPVSGELLSLNYDPPTHWQPLPEPPK